MREMPSYLVHSTTARQGRNYRGGGPGGLSPLAKRTRAVVTFDRFELLYYTWPIATKWRKNRVPCQRRGLLVLVVLLLRRPG